MGKLPDFCRKVRENVCKRSTTARAWGLCRCAFFIWGFQPLYWYMCTNVCGEIDTFFIMACRIIWAAVACLCILKVEESCRSCAAVFRTSRCSSGRCLHRCCCSATGWCTCGRCRTAACWSAAWATHPAAGGICPWGPLSSGEKMNWRHFVIIAIVVVGIVFSTSGFGGVPYVTIALALMFSIYAAIKKSLTIDSIVSTTSEILMDGAGGAAVHPVFPYGETTVWAA